jgi:hypothetical protein
MQKVISRWGSRVQQPFIDFKTQTNFLIFFFFSFYSMNLFLLHIVIILKEFSDLMQSICINFIIYAGGM